MKDAEAKKVVLQEIIASMKEDSIRGLSARLKKKEDPKKKKAVKVSALSDIRSMLS